LIYRIGVIQFVNGDELRKRASNQQVTHEILSPSRGIIYDSKGEALAQSIAVDTISLNPGYVKYYDGDKVENEVIAEGISRILELDYNKTLEDISSEKAVVILKRKVESDKVDELKKWMEEKSITTGINFDADNKRIYPYKTLASNLIGFCGTDNVGQVGLEERWNSVLTGTAGKLTTTIDVHGNAISDEYEQYVETENGSNIYLTIDTTIQSIAEQYLENAMQENPTAKSGNVIIMNPQNGDILAMATNPYYNLNDPSSYIATGYTKEEWEKFESAERTNILLNLWKNKAVSDQYEPGSTFKLITSSVALEENVVQTDTPGDFFCSRSISCG